MSLLEIMKFWHVRKKPAIVFSQAKKPEETLNNIIKKKILRERIYRKCSQENIYNIDTQQDSFEAYYQESILGPAPQQGMLGLAPQESTFDTAPQETTPEESHPEVVFENAVQIYEGSPDQPESISQRQYRQQENCFIVKLAQELILLIAENLTLYEKIMFSHSCHIIRWILSCDCKKELRRLTLPERVVFLMDITYNKPDRFVCTRCIKLHIVDTDDYPSRRRPPECIGRSSSVTSGRHRLEHHHLQSAHKLYRLNLNLPYLGKLLANYKHTFIHGTTSYTYNVCPRICGEHFILLQKMKIGNAVRRLIQRDFEQSFIVVCPQAALPRSFWPILEDIVKGLYPLRVLEAVTTIALSVPGREVRGHCCHCHTDFAVLFSITERGIVFTIWSNYGQYSSPMTLQWTTKVCSRRHEWSFQVLVRPLGDCRRDYFSK